MQKSVDTLLQENDLEAALAQLTSKDTVVSDYHAKEIAKFLISPKLTDEKKLSAVFTAAAEGNQTALVNELLSTAIAHGQLELVRLFLSKLKTPIGYKELKLALDINNPHVDIARLLLEREDVRTQAAIEDNALLRQACLVGDLEAVKTLLTVDEVRAHIATRNNEALVSAIQEVNVDIVKYLLEFEEVKQQLVDDNNKILNIACQFSNARIVSALLAVPAVKEQAAAGGNGALRTALQRGASGIFIQLLQIPSVLDQLADDPDIIRELISRNIDYTNIPQVIDLFAKHPKLNLLDVFILAAQNKDTLKNNLVLLFNRLDRNQKFKYLSLSEVFNENTWTVDNLILFLQDPVLYLSNHENNLPRAKLEAMKLLQLAEQVKQTDFEQNIAFGRNSETSMDPVLLSAAEKHFQEIIVPLFKQRLLENGGSKDETTAVVNVEKLIREEILKIIKQNAISEKNHYIVAFITINMYKLIQGDDKELMKQARSLFNSHSSPSHIAWRGYDPQAPVRSGWINILTDSSPETFEARKRTAYYFLVATDVGDTTSTDKNVLETAKLLKESKEDRITNFIAQLADIRRAHNRSSNDEDDPSCYPGTLGRIAQMGNWHPQAQLPLNEPKFLLPQILRPLLISALDAYMVNLSQKEKEALYWGIVLLNRSTAENMLIKYLDSPTLPDAHDISLDEMMKQRNGFIQSLGSEEEVLEKVNQQLIAIKVRELRKVERVYLRQNILDLSFGPVGAQLEKYLRGGIFKDTKDKALSQELKKKRREENPFETLVKQCEIELSSPSSLKNPMIKKRLEARLKMFQKQARVYVDFVDLIKSSFETLLKRPVARQMVVDIAKSFAEEVWTQSLIKKKEMDNPESLRNAQDKIKEVLSHHLQSSPLIDLDKNERGLEDFSRDFLKLYIAKHRGTMDGKSEVDEKDLKARSRKKPLT